MGHLVRLRDAGKIRYIGISNFSAEQTREALEFGPIHSSQPRYNMLFRAAGKSVLPACLERGVGIIAHSPLAKGMLTGKYRPGHTFPADDERNGHAVFRPGGFEAAQPYVDRLSAWAADQGRTITQLAIAWTLAHPAVTSSIVGAKTPEQVVENASAAEWRLTDSELAEVNGILGSFSLDVAQA